jgi:hypothetical protein
MFVLDDAQCTLHMNVNSQNNRLCCSENPPYVCEVPAHDKVKVWCAVHAHKITIMTVLKNCYGYILATLYATLWGINRTKKQLQTCVLRNISRKSSVCLETGRWHYENFP